MWLWITESELNSVENYEWWIELTVKERKCWKLKVIDGENDEWKWLVMNHKKKSFLDINYDELEGNWWKNTMNKNNDSENES